MNSRRICEFKMHLMSWFMKSIRQMDRHKLRSNGICLWAHRCMLLLSMPLANRSNYSAFNRSNHSTWMHSELSWCLGIELLKRTADSRQRRLLNVPPGRHRGHPRDIIETFPNDFKFMDDFEFADSLKKFAWHFGSTWWPERCEVASSNAIKCKSSRCPSNECESYECESSRSYRSSARYWVVTHNLLVHVATLRDSKGALDSKV